MLKFCCLALLSAMLAFYPGSGRAAPAEVWQIYAEDGTHITDICYEPNAGDIYISADNTSYEVVQVNDSHAVVHARGSVALPSVDWLDADAVIEAASRTKTIAMYCTHSDESYEPNDGYYSTTERGTIYQIAEAFASALADDGVEAIVADTLHHPHDAGAYRRSRQTAVDLLKRSTPDCLIDVHRDGIPDPAAYAVVIGGEEVSKIRLLVGRGNQNAELNKDFALLIKSVADYVYPGLIKDIYLGKGTFNQDLLPRSILFECGTYTLEKERVLASMPLLADVLSRALYGDVIGSAGRVISDSNSSKVTDDGVVNREPESTPVKNEGVGSGFGFLGVLLLIGVVGIAVLSAGSLRGGARKATRNLSEMTGGLVGKRPEKDEEHEHS